MIGSYDLHDFFMYNMLRYHEAPDKMFEVACLAVPKVSPEKIYQAEQTFYSRFFAQQFKRNVMQDCVKFGSINL